MRIAVPTEVKNNEFRVAMTPVGVHELTRRGHEVYVQAGAGAGSSFTDEEFAAQGARIVEGAEATWAAGEMVLKVKEPIESEYRFLRPGLVLFTYLHLAADRPLTEELLAKRVTSIAYETVETANGQGVRSAYTLTQAGKTIKGVMLILPNTQKAFTVIYISGSTAEEVKGFADVVVQTAH